MSEGGSFSAGEKVFFAVVLFVFGIFIGGIFSYFCFGDLRKEAVKNGCAVWVSGEDGRAKFEWRKP